MKKIFISRWSRALPNKESRNFHLRRNSEFTVEKFETYNDWFYFIHVDPFIRWIHALGMVIGLFFYVVSAYRLWLFGFHGEVIIQFLTGAFFFYFLPLISHYFYDGGTAKSTPDKFHSTLIPVIHINFLTLTGTYDRWLRNFIKKYPFIIDAWELEERHVRK